LRGLELARVKVRVTGPRTRRHCLDTNEHLPKLPLHAIPDIRLHGVVRAVDGVAVLKVDGVGVGDLANQGGLGGGIPATAYSNMWYFMVTSEKFVGMAPTGAFGVPRSSTLG